MIDQDNWDERDMHTKTDEDDEDLLPEDNEDQDEENINEDHD